MVLLLYGWVGRIIVWRPDHGWLGMGGGGLGEFGDRTVAVVGVSLEAGTRFVEGGQVFISVGPVGVALFSESEFLGTGWAMDSAAGFRGEGFTEGAATDGAGQVDALTTDEFVLSGPLRFERGCLGLIALGPVAQDDAPLIEDGWPA